jgi:kanamycin kinase
LGGLTYRYLTADAAPRFFTWVPGPHGAGLRSATRRAAWLAPHVTVPRFDQVRDGFGGQWTTSAAIPGASAVALINAADPVNTVRQIGIGLQLLHDRAPADRCPFTWDPLPRIEAARRRLATDPTWRRAPDAYLHTLSDADALALLHAGTERDTDLVVCHGDACAPNTIIGPDGRFAGLVDLGRVGVADRWADLAVATWSLNWNFGPGWDEVFLDAYGIGPDPAKTAFYRLLWNLDGQ